MSTEPAVITGLVLAVIQAVLTLVVALGFDLTAEQSTAIMGASAAVLALIGAVVVRSKVTPV